MNHDEEFDEQKYLNDPEYRRRLAERKRSKTGKKRDKQKTVERPFYRNPVVIIGSFIIMIVLGGILFIHYLMQGLPSIAELENPRTDVASFVMSRDNEVLDTYFVENRTYVPYDRISTHVVNALVATEDHRFYDHWGIDIVRTAAIPYHLLRGRRQGGSTISQQLARNLYKSIGREVTPTRKLREIITAIQIERSYTKKEIIEMYLNTVEFSNSAFGIEAAARTHFNKTASDLDIMEAATLIGTLQAVFAYNPRLRTEQSTVRRNVVMGQMLKHGFLTNNEFSALREEPILLNYQRPHSSNRQSRYFGEYIRQQISSWAVDNGYDLFRDGLVIYTTIDSKMQHYAERAVEEKLIELQAQFEQEWTSSGGEYMDKLWAEFPTFLNSFIEESEEYREAYDVLRNHKAVLDSLGSNKEFVLKIKKQRARLESGFVAIEPATGHILAWVGGTDYSTIQRDNVHQLRRQPGSTFKPFVYAVAIDNGYKPFHRFSKYPVSFRDRAGRAWRPRDPVISEGPEMVTLREALARSFNNVTVRLLPELAGAPGTNRLEDLFPAAEKIAEMATRLGITSNLQAYPAIALGTSEVSLLELVGAYTTFANMGVHVEPMAVTRIEDKEGNILYEEMPRIRGEVISPETAYVMIDMMRGVIRGGDWGYGTGVRMRNMGVTQDVAGKTGTSQNSADNWFVAMMPHVVIGAWVGGEDRRIRFPQNTVVGQGARTALPMVADFINLCKADPNITWSLDAFQQPAGFIPEEYEESAADRVQVRDERRGRVGW
ncbi:MAG: penicillin-binding protein 1A [Cyclonatronaceae bacterium]